MGRIVGPKVAARWGRPILELGGNNAMIVAPSADLDMAVRAIAFGAVGTAGQRCTSLRRLIVHRSMRDDLVARLAKAYASLPVGDPRKAGTLIGPLIDMAAATGCWRRSPAPRPRVARCTAGQVVEAVAGGAYVTPRAGRDAEPDRDRAAKKPLRRSSTS
jgi:aldehyde dehydrogenase (NAD+)